VSEALGVALMVLVGAQLAPQAPINRGLSHRVGGLAAAFVNFAVGGVLILVVCAAAGKLGGVWGVWHVPPGDLAGGLLGAGFVLLALLCVGSIGASGVAAATVTGQLIASLALDATGALGLERRSPTAPVLLGALAVLAGTLLILPRERAVAGPDPAPALARLGPGAAMVLGGALLGVQHPLNGQLAGSIGDLPSSVVNFAVGAGALLAVLAGAGQAPRLTRLPGVPRHLLVGGVFGALNVTVALTMVDRIGAGALAAATVTGQLIASLALDRAGLLGLRPHPVTRRRAAGALLLIAGTVLVAV
jgi:transporter family-2 protein